MHPDLFSIGPVTLHAYGLFAAVGLFVALAVAVRIGKAEGIPTPIVVDMGFVMILSAVIGSRALYVLANLSYFGQRPLDALKVWHGGLIFSGGLLAALFAMGWFAKRHALPFLKIGDVWAPAAALGQAIGRIGCFMAGCCYGKPTSAFWGITFTDPDSFAPRGVPLHPTQIYASLGGLAVFAILALLSRKKKFDGQVLLWFLILHSTVQLFLERFRGDDRGLFLNSQMTPSQLLATLTLMAAVVGVGVLSSRRRAAAGHED